MKIPDCFSREFCAKIIAHSAPASIGVFTYKIVHHAQAKRVECKASKDATDNKANDQKKVLDG